MGWQPGEDQGAGAEPGPGFGRADVPVVSPASPTSTAADFAQDGAWDASLPSAALVAALESASGPDWRCADASRDELTGLLRQWQAVESWAAAAKLGVLRALIRDDDQPLPGGSYRGDLPEGWTRSLTHEVALALSMPAVTAEKQMWVAWDLEVRLPGLARLLAAGDLTYPKAKAVYEAFLPLSDDSAARAEALILPGLPGKTYGQAQQLAVAAALAVDPESAAARREDAERSKSRVQLFREESGAAGLSGRDLPTDQTLAAHANVCARAQDYKDSGAFPADTRMDQFRVAAYLDLLNDIAPEVRIASGQLVTVTRTSDGGEPAKPDPDEPEPDAGEPGPEPDAGPGPEPGAPGPGAGPQPGGSAVEPQTAPRLTDLVVPLVTLLGRAERPGEGHGLGPLDPRLCRELAAAAVTSPWTRLCVTVTTTDGVAIGHGCAKPPRRTKNALGAARTTGPVAGLPARMNLTITTEQLAQLIRAGQPPPGLPWSFTPVSDSGPPGGSGPPGNCGTWLLTRPDGRQFTVALEPVPTFDCDHRHQSHAYQPNDTLRHLVQIRDGECTFPPCSRHARESDFEHAVPYDQGGPTCGCNAGARSRTCHQVKQSRGWHVTQPQPGWHEWQTPSGRRYTQGPKRYPV